MCQPQSHSVLPQPSLALSPSPPELTLHFEALSSLQPITDLTYLFLFLIYRTCRRKRSIITAVPAGWGIAEKRNFGHTGKR